MNGIMEKIDNYLEELKTIQEKVKRVKNKTEIEENSNEYNRIEETFKTDIEINSIKIEMSEHFKER